MTTTQTEKLEMRIVRAFRASPEKVFDAWTDPAKLAKWFGPDGFTTTTHEMDLRPGGMWRHTMLGPDGRKYPNEIRFVEVERPHRLVYDHLSTPPFRTTVTLDADGKGGTRMTFVGRFADREAYRIATETFGAIEGQKETTERLADLVDGPGFTLVREFARAPPERVWAMWTTPEGVMRWWAPSAKEMGFEFRVLELDARVGGRYRFSMKGNGHDLVNGGTYTAVQPHTELAWLWHYDIYLQPGEQPYDIPIRVRFEPLPAGGTRMTFREGSMRRPEFTKSSRDGVEQNFRYLAAALEG